MVSLVPQSTFLSSRSTISKNTTDTSSTSALSMDFNITTLEPDSDNDKFFDPSNNPWNVMSAATARMLTQIVDSVYILFVAVGVPANIINCLVFFRQGLRDRMNLCLCWLAASDMCFLVALAIMSSVSFLLELVRPEIANKYDVHTDLYMIGITLAFHVTSASTSVIIAVDRCLCVLFPLKVKAFISTRGMAILFLTLSGLIHLGFMILPLRMRVLRIANTQTGQSLWIMAPRQGPSQAVWKVMYAVVFDVFLLFVMNIGAVSAVLVCTVITVARLKLALAWRLTKSSRESDVQIQQVALTKMLVVVCGVYVVCSFPACIMVLVRQLEPGYVAYGKYYNVFAFTHKLGYEVFAAFNSSVNFFVFYNRSSRFRQELRRMCHGKENGGVEKKQSKAIYSNR